MLIQVIGSLITLSRRVSLKLKLKLKLKLMMSAFEVNLRIHPASFWPPCQR